VGGWIGDGVEGENKRRWRREMSDTLRWEYSFSILAFLMG
jgi:hypothetical protein